MLILRYNIVVTNASQVSREINLKNNLSIVIVFYLTYRNDIVGPVVKTYHYKNWHF